MIFQSQIRINKEILELYPFSQEKMLDNQVEQGLATFGKEIGKTFKYKRFLDTREPSVLTLKLELFATTREKWDKFLDCISKIKYELSHLPVDDKISNELTKAINELE